MYQPKHVQTRSPQQRTSQTSRRPYGPNQYQYPLTREEQDARRTGRAEAARMRTRARRRRKLRRFLPLLGILLAVGIGVGGVFLVHSLLDNRVQPEEETQISDTQPEPETETPAISETPTAPEKNKTVFRPTPDSVRIAVDDESIHSGYLILVDLDEKTILASKNAWTVIHPASMTKIMTLLVAAEHLKDLTASAAVSQLTIDFCIQNNCSVAGFLAEEEVPIMDLLYGTILPSGADAALTLAEYVAGSQETFVELMNEKAEELGIADTAHFANCVGLYDENNVCTPYDMAVILNAAMENGLCRKILGERIHDIPSSELHPQGISLSNWFIRRIEDHMPAGTAVKGAKTGFINEAGNCAASLAQDSSGHTCICVTAMAGSVWQCIFDHVALYENYGFSPNP